jgi:hypothetical protein
MLKLTKKERVRMIPHIKSAIMFTNFFIGRAMLEVFIRPRPIKRLLKGKLIKKALRNYTQRAARTNISAEMSKEPSYIIWQYWEQGLDNAPDIVKACVNSVEKYKNGKTEYIIPAEISEKTKKELGECLKKLYLALEIKDLCRFDFFLTEKGELIFNEVNTMPGMTNESLFPKIWHYSGYSLMQILDNILNI